tara:strand:- start:11832 stop:12992 length:1161 start_codon:yes stop_codon:yes gene_type:complete
MVCFISGLGPGEAGASGFYSYIKKISKDKSMTFLYPYEHKSFRRLFFTNKLKALLYLLKINFLQILFTLKVIFLKPQNVILAHPQGIGLLLSMYIILRNKRINYYVLDNSFFCVQSYNYHQKEGECLRCLGMSNKPFRDCKSFPGFRLREIHSYFISFLIKNQEKIKFFFQNETQLELFNKHMSSKSINHEKIGLLTLDLLESFDDYKKFHYKSKYLLSRELGLYDLFKKDFIVFHGNDHDAKGSKIGYKLARYLPEYNFIFPFSKPNMELPDNCIFLPCSWKTGLKDLIIYAKCVLCTSLWSAPIEAALVKSILYNGVIITSKTKKSFSQEIPEEFNLIYKSDESINEIKRKLKDEKKLIIMKKNLINWLENYFLDTKLERLFNF